MSVKHSEYKCVNGAGRDKRSDTVDGVHYIQAKHVFSPRIWHGFFGRVGGCSVGTYSSLNCGLYTQDDAEKVAQNVRIVIKAVNESCGFCAFDVVKMLHQVHSDVVLHIKNSGQDTKFVEADAMITTVQGVLLAVQTADCVPILLCDCDCTVVAAIHAGWRSATSGIIQNTIAKIFELQKISQQQKVMAIIGPAIHADHYEVDREFCANLTAIDPKNAKYCTSRDSCIRFDLITYCKDKLMESGRCKRVFDMCADTYSNANSFFSYRRALKGGGKECGRQLSVIGIKNVHVVSESDMRRI